uniref:Uncharacterized protein n=1 Tax=Solanum lycopersicum TaxID=4081 RepID=A0A3Q7ESC0_SOLLC
MGGGVRVLGELDMRKTVAEMGENEPWWNTAGNNPVSLGLMRGSPSDSPSPEQAVDGLSQSDGGSNEEADDTPEKSQSTIPKHSELDGSYVQVDQNLQPMASAIPPKGDGCITQPPQFELVAHSMACAPNLYVDPYYGGILAPFGQPMIQSVPERSLCLICLGL